MSPQSAKSCASPRFRNTRIIIFHYISFTFKQNVKNNDCVHLAFMKQRQYYCDNGDKNTVQVAYLYTNVIGLHLSRHSSTNIKAKHVSWLNDSLKLNQNRTTRIWRSPQLIMALKLFVVILVLSVVLEFSAICQGQDYKCLVTPCKREVRSKKSFWKHFTC